jgi:hypothetical protein
LHAKPCALDTPTKREKKSEIKLPFNWIMQQFEAGGNFVWRNKREKFSLYDTWKCSKSSCWLNEASHRNHPLNYTELGKEKKRRLVLS